MPARGRGGGTSLKLARRAFVIVASAFGLMLPGLAFPEAATAATDAATIAASAPQVTFGADVVFSGAVEAADPACLGPRPVSLQSRRSDQADYTDLAQGTTSADGAFSFAQAPDSSANFRAAFPEFVAGNVTCLKITSNHVHVGVSALVEDSLGKDSIAAGNCVTMSVTVQPDKSGQDVELQRKQGGAWTTIETRALNASSELSRRLCFGWPDIGTTRLRARWTGQDGLNETGTGPVLALAVVQAAWMNRIDELTGGRQVSVSVGLDGEFLYQRRETVPRTPASNQKLVLSMALLDELGVDHHVVTHAAAETVKNGVVQGDLWILGRGDPSIDGGDLTTLARVIEDAGIARITGSVMGSTGYFSHDWSAPGWDPDFPKLFIPLPTALTYNGNVAGGVHISDPERRAAVALTDELESRGINVKGKPGAGSDPGGLEDVATIESPKLTVLLRRQNVQSVNFYAEVLGKLLGAERSGVPGTIAKGAAAIDGWASDHGASVTARDCSGLSYDNRVTAQGLVKLLWFADDASWGTALRKTLPTGDQGTLEDRLNGVQVRAKTGTLTDISALSGWVWLEEEETWAEFSILSSGMSKTTAAAIEDSIVRTLLHNAH